MHNGGLSPSDNHFEFKDMFKSLKISAALGMGKLGNFLSASPVHVSCVLIFGSEVLFIVEVTEYGNLRFNCIGTIRRQKKNAQI